MSSHTTHRSHKHNNNKRTHRIHFLSALASVPVPPKLLKGVQIFTVAANGKTQPATLTLSEDRFTAFIDDCKDTSSGGSSGGGVFGLFKEKSNLQKRAIDIG